MAPKQRRRCSRGAVFPYGAAISGALEVQIDADAPWCSGGLLLVAA